MLYQIDPLPEHARGPKCGECNPRTSVHPLQRILKAETGNQKLEIGSFVLVYCPAWDFPIDWVLRRHRSQRMRHPGNVRKLLIMANFSATQGRRFRATF